MHPLFTPDPQQCWAAQDTCLLDWALGFWPKMKIIADPWRWRTTTVQTESSEWLLSKGFISSSYSALWVWGSSDLSVATRYHVTCVLVQAAVGPWSLRTAILSSPQGTGHMIRNHLWKAVQTGGISWPYLPPFRVIKFSALWYAEHWEKSGLRWSGHPPLPRYW